uniref:BHLH domain-containing protein n=1 Tax=Macrostomum lignano TaxID=282301 RepID=A0A1I8FN83_9PLAT
NSSSAVTAGVFAPLGRGLGGFSRSSWGRAALSSARLSDFPAGSAPAVQLRARRSMAAPAELPQLPDTGAKLVSELAPRPMERSHLRPCSRSQFTTIISTRTQLANGRLARRAIIRSSSRHSTQLPVTPGCPRGSGWGLRLAATAAGRDLRAAAIGPEPLHELGGPGCLACVSSPRPGNLSTVISICAARVATRENYPTQSSSIQRSLLASRPTQRCSTPLPPRAAWDFRSGGTGGGAGGSATSAAAAAGCGGSAGVAAASSAPRTPAAPGACTRSIRRHHHPRPAAISRNPFDPQSRIPLPHPFGEFHFGCESSFIRAAQRAPSRERVRFVNEGYERLKETLPFENKDKRISKTAIRYIQHMESLLRAADQQQQAEPRSSGLKRRPLGPSCRRAAREAAAAGLTGEGAAAPGHKAGLMAIASGWSSRRTPRLQQAAHVAAKVEEEGELQQHEEGAGAAAETRSATTSGSPRPDSWE